MKFKKMISGVVGVTVLSASLTVGAASFSDVKGHWAAEYVSSMVEQGYIKGYEDGTFKPDKTVSNTESLILISRMLGVDDRSFEKTVETAVAEYANVLSKYDTDYEREISFLLYRGVLDKSDLDTYISNSNKNTALARYQCAMLITKLLGADEVVKNSLFISSSYADTAKIPAEARPYVEYVREAKIMEGMGVDSYGDPMFEPMESVTRGQMAKMLSSLIDVLDIQSKSGVVEDVDSFEDTVKIGGKTYTAESGTEIKVDGKSASLSDISEGMEAVVMILCDKVAMIDVYSPEAPDAPVRGIVVSAKEDSSGKTLVISDAEDSSKRSTYKVGNNVKIVIESAIDSFGKLKSNQYVEITFENKEISKIEVINKSETVTATLVSKDINSQTPSVTVSDVKGVTSTYPCSAEGVSVTKNDSAANLSDLIAGDSVVLKLNYGKVTKISAASSNQNLEGKIVSITHTEQGSSLKITVGSKTNEYSIGNSTEIKIDGSGSTVYDLRPGSSVKFRTESSLITRLETTQTVAKNTIEGEVTLVQSNYNLLFVNDGDTEQTIVVNSATNIIRSKTGASIKLAGVSKGDKVTVIGNNTTGVFVATVIVIQ